MGEPLCRIARENGGTVPLDCFFHCPRGCQSDLPPAPADDGRGRAPAIAGVHCNRCGSTDIRWRHQGGKWVLFSLQPGVLHRCSNAATADEFDVV